MEWYFWLIIAVAPVIFLPLLVYKCKKWKESHTIVAPQEPVSLKYQGQGQADEDGAEAFWSRKDRKAGERKTAPDKQELQSHSADNGEPSQSSLPDQTSHSTLPPPSLPAGGSLKLPPASMRPPPPQSMRALPLLSVRPPRHQSMRSPPQSMRSPQQLPRSVPSQQLSPMSRPPPPQMGPPQSQHFPPQMMQPAQSQQLSPLPMRPPPSQQAISVSQDWGAAVDERSAHAFYGSDAFQYDANL